MRILFTANQPFGLIGSGAARSNYALIRELALHGNILRLVTPYNDAAVQEPRNELAQIEICTVQDPAKLCSQLAQEIATFNPDFIFVSSEDMRQSLVEVAVRERPQRVVYLAHTPQMLPFGPLSLFPSITRTQLLQQVGLVVCISQFMAQYVQTHAGIAALVAHPPHYGNGPFQHVARYDNAYVMFINPCQVKGMPIFEAIAQALPAVQFGVIHGWGTTQQDARQLAGLPNVVSLPRQKAMDEAFYKQVRALLMPTVWGEGFGMTAVEAMLHGVPVLASDSGGLPEAMLGQLDVIPVCSITQYLNQLDDKRLPVPVMPPQDVRPWVQALSGLLSHPVAYAQRSKAAYQAANQFVSTLNINALVARLQGMQALQRSTRPIPMTMPNIQIQPVPPTTREQRLQAMTPQQRDDLMQMLREQRQRKVPINRACKAGEASEGNAADEHPNNMAQKAAEHVWVINFLRRHKTATKRTISIELKPGDASPALFLVHPASGEVDLYRDLAEQLTWPGRIIGLQDPLVLEDDRSSLTLNVVDLAKRYANAIQQAQPSGPYYLAGHSYGGVVAFELACQLRAQNQEVAFVGIIDTAPPHVLGPVFKHMDETAMLTTMIEDWGLTVELTTTQMTQANLIEIIRHAQQRYAFLAEFEPSWLIGMIERFKARAHAVYEPAVYSGDVMLFRAAQNQAQLPKVVQHYLAAKGTHAAQVQTLWQRSDWGWQDIVAGQVQSHLLPGHHATLLLRPHVNELVRLMQTALHLAPLLA